MSRFTVAGLPTAAKLAVPIVRARNDGGAGK
jgi:hypothetical protein